MSKPRRDIWYEIVLAPRSSSEDTPEYLPWERITSRTLRGAKTIACNEFMNRGLPQGLMMVRIVIVDRTDPKTNHYSKQAYTLSSRPNVPQKAWNDTKYAPTYETTVQDLVRHYDVYEDPGHGWLKTTHEELKKFGLQSKISGYSYMRGDDVFLEEDCDLSLFIETLEAQGYAVQLRRHVARMRQSKIRNYQPYAPRR